MHPSPLSGLEELSFYNAPVRPVPCISVVIDQLNSFPLAQKKQAQFFYFEIEPVFPSFGLLARPISKAGM